MFMSRYQPPKATEDPQGNKKAKTSVGDAGDLKKTGKPMPSVSQLLLESDSESDSEAEDSATVGAKRKLKGKEKANVKELDDYFMDSIAKEVDLFDVLQWWKVRI